MNKTDLCINEKLKSDLMISSINIPHKIKVILEFSEHYFTIKFPVNFEKKNKIYELVNHIFHPILKNEKENIFYINYALVKVANIFEVSTLRMQIYNPISSNNFTLNFKSIESVGVLFNKKKNFENLTTICRKISNLINLEIKYLIEQFLYLFTLLRDCLDPKKSENPIIEEILLKAYLNGKAYYEKYLNELKKNAKLKMIVQKDINDQLDNVASGNTGNDSLRAKKNYTTKVVSPIEQTDISFESFATFDSLLNEFKIRTSIYIEGSIALFFKVVSVEQAIVNSSFKGIDTKVISHNLKSVNEREKLKLKNKFQMALPSSVSNANRSVIEKKNNFTSEFSENYSESTKTGSKKKTQKKNRSFTPDNNNELLETPKFYEKNRRKNYQNNDNNTNNGMSINEVLKHIDEGKKLHTFVPPINTQNIFFNTAEIIHRKFFEYIFEEFLGKIFSYEKDNDNLIKLDSLYNYFVYLRGMKNILFIEKNRIYFSSVFFMDDDEGNPS